MSEEKINIRKKVLKKRNNLNFEDIKKRSRNIRDQLFDSYEYRNSADILFYVSFGSEVNTFGMIEESLSEKNKRVYVPVIEEVKKNICPVRICSLNELVHINKLGILEPSYHCKFSELKKENNPKNKLDLIVVPVVAFDKKKHRIGYGKGYYDRFFYSLENKVYECYKIGLAFKEQEVDEIPRKIHDFPLDKLIVG